MLRELTRASDNPQGFELLRLYRASAHAASTREIAGAVNGIDVWRRIGLPRPADAWPKRALALSGALAAIVRNPPAGPSAVAAAWLAVSGGDEMLKDLPSRPVEDFLVHRLFDPAVPERGVRSLHTARARRERTARAPRRAVGVA